MNKEKKYALISSIFFLLAVLSDLIVRFTNSYGLRWTIPSSLSSITLILLWIFQVGLAIVVFIRHKKLVMAVAGINTILFVFNFFYSYNWGWVFAIIAYIAFIAVVFLALKENNIVNSIWFIPSITLLISFILVLVFRYLVSMGIFSPFALFFAGLWLKENLPDTIQKPKNHSTQSIQINAVGGADRIKMYKELLDSGAITQEEFDAKKKEILG